MDKLNIMHKVDKPKLEEEKRKLKIKITHK